MQSAMGVLGGMDLFVAGPQRSAMILDPLTFLIGSGAGLIVWLLRRHRKNRREATLSVAWHEVLDDPHYAERRRIEERRLFIRQAGNHSGG